METIFFQRKYDKEKIIDRNIETLGKIVKIFLEGNTNRHDK